MNSTKRISAVKVTFFALIFVGLCSRLTSSTICERGSGHGYCHLEAVSVTTDDEATKFVFPNGPGIAFYKSKILSPAKILFGRLPDYVKTVYISDSHVPKVYINQTIYEFYAFGSSVQEVIIDRTSTYKLTDLWIARNLLRSVPENLSKLTNLVNLYMYGNKIETVSMDHFKDLTNLKILSLYSNSIVRVDTASPLNLPMLEKLYLYNNKIQHLSITFWNFPNLHNIYLYQNMLRSIMNFPRRFPKLRYIDVRENQWSCAWLEAIKSEMSKIRKYNEICSGKSVDKICCQDYSIDDTSFNSFEERMTFEILQVGENLQEAIQQINDKNSKQTTDTRVLIDTKMSDVGRSVQKNTDEVKSTESNVRKLLQEMQKINTKLDENRASILFILDDQKKFQQEIVQIRESISKMNTDLRMLVDNKISDIGRNIQGIQQEVKSVKELQKSNADDLKKLQQSNTNLQKETEKTGASVSKQSTEIQKEVKSMESNIKKEVHQEMTKINEKVLENQVFILDDRKQFQQTSEKLKKGIDTNGEIISNLTTDTKVLIDSKLSNVSRTIQGMEQAVKSMESSIMKQVEELQKTNADDRKQFQQAIDKIGESISKMTTDTRELIDSKITNMTGTVKEIKVEQNQEIQKINVRVDENRASIVDDRKQLEEKISNADNQNKEEFKWVKQKLNENRALIDDVVDDLYLADLEKQDV